MLPENASHEAGHVARQHEAAEPRYHRPVALMKRTVPMLVVLGVMLAAGCTGNGDTDGGAVAPTVKLPASDSPAQVSTVAPVRDEFRRSVETICADVTAALVDRAPREGATPAAAAAALTSMVDANRGGVDRLRVLEAPAELPDAFSSWLDLVDETARHLEVGSLALRAGDEATFTQALGEAAEEGAEASAAALELGLPGCAFTS